MVYEVTLSFFLNENLLLLGLCVISYDPGPGVSFSLRGNFFYRPNPQEGVLVDLWLGLIVWVPGPGLRFFFCSFVRVDLPIEKAEGIFIYYYIMMMLINYHMYVVV
jgi:hypothetical protein